VNAIAPSSVTAARASGGLRHGDDLRRHFGQASTWRGYRARAGISADALFARAARWAAWTSSAPKSHRNQHGDAPADRPLLWLHRSGGRHSGKDYAELGAKPRVIATGGLAADIEDSRYIAEIDDMLTLDGLLILFERNARRGHAQAH